MIDPRFLRSSFTSVFVILLMTFQMSACSTEEGLTNTTHVDSGANVSLTWVAPVQREDGTPISMAEIAGYRVYYGTSQGNYTNEVDITDRSSMQATLSGLASGIYYIAVTTYDTEGRESTFSPEVTKTI